VIVFAGLTVWDAQRLKALAFATNAGGMGSVAIVGALARSVPLPAALSR